MRGSPWTAVSARCGKRPGRKRPRSEQPHDQVCHAILAVAAQAGHGHQQVMHKLLRVGIDDEAYAKLAQVEF